MDTARFEWDPAKDFENFAKHSVSFFEAQAAFADERRVVVEDLGRVAQGILTVRFTVRSGAIRIIGAGFWRKGKAIYERENSIQR